MNIKEFMDKNIEEIANERAWDCKREGCPSDCRFSCPEYNPSDMVDCRPTCKKSCLHNCPEKHREDFCPRMKDYDRYVGELLPHLGKDMKKVTFDDVKFALNKVREEYGYAESTIRGIQSCVSVLYTFASTHEGMYNIMEYISFKGCKKDILSILTSGRSKKAIRQELEMQREKHKHRTKSLSPWQLEKLTQLLWDLIEEDGRYCMIALMLYTGVRPAEGRAVLWKDVVPFLDHPGRWLLTLYKIRDDGGNLKLDMKSENAYRRIPLHHELMMLLKKRRDYVLKCNPGKDISDFPVCCFENNFQTPCRDFEVCKLTDKVFEKIKLRQQDMYVYMLDAEAEKLSGKQICSEKGQQLTLYVLRRAFWTWCASLTQLDDFEKRYIMGHDMKIGTHSVHARYNDENKLWDICQKLDHCVIGKTLHESALLLVPKANIPIQVENRGLVRIHLTRDMLAKGGILQCFATTEEAGEALTLVSCSPLRKYGKLIPEADVLPVPVKNQLPVGINCEYENWLAHINPTGPLSEEKKSASAETTQPEECAATGPIATETGEEITKAD